MTARRPIVRSAWTGIDRMARWHEGEGSPLDHSDMGYVEEDPVGA